MVAEEEDLGGLVALEEGGVVDLEDMVAMEGEEEAAMVAAATEEGVAASEVGVVEDLTGSGKSV